jgi:magnesium-protoporphyrin O-methyltransferase
MDCCSVDRGLNRAFGRRLASRWASGFRKRDAPDRRHRAILDRLAAEGIEGASVLDVGFGVGDLHFELLRRGAATVVGVEVSSAMSEQARTLAGELGFAERVDHRLGDYAQLAAELGDADVVVLDRSVCCYPDWRALVEPSARHARRFYALMLPRDTWYMRAGVRAINLGLAAIRHEFRTYMHPRDQIDAVLAEAGLTLVLSSTTWRDDAALYAPA